MTLKEKQETATAWTKEQEHKKSTMAGAEITPERRERNKQLIAETREKMGWNKPKTSIQKSQDTSDA